ncbi:glutathione S-transferase family protein [Desulfopila sp. IMCC35006]|uniref:glutathione S-transferase family protein n=1 Tax=Desulfopila sp. IMCC35006 TaxID=2569542 RepID=UPI0010AD86B4|nr:glutathione S-transferase family protein [Desulfopila sp. IMCC35006]TKB24476.1 glutathione S-transferase family protein [Desulfopila sp. IMCC35006]
MKLIIGNKNYSSWSLRAWLLLAAKDLPFEEVRIPLCMENTESAIAEYTAAGKVPVLIDNDLTVWDSLAICEYISEQYLDGNGWPADAEERAVARSCCAEMHSGFFTLREAMPMNCRAVNRRVPMTAELQEDISRIDSLWTWLREKHAPRGPWLFGEFSIADCMFAPVVFRFSTYNTAVSDISQNYIQTVLEHPKIQLWREQAKGEVETIEGEEVGM